MAPASPEDIPELLFIPPNTTKSLSYKQAIQHYIATAYANNAATYADDCTSLDTLREQSVHINGSVDLAALQQVTLYYSQVSFLGSRFPLDIALKFEWRSPFPNVSKPVAHSNLEYEKACLLFTMASIYSTLGCQENRVSTEGIRKTCNYFQHAAGCFRYIERELMPNLRPDLSSNMLDALTSLMLAQAQEAVWHKAIMEHMKSGTVARLAIKVADYYSSVLSDKSVCELLPSSWHTYIRIKAAYYTATSQYNKANECISLSRYGEEIARLRLAASFNRQALEAIESGSSFLRGSLSINATLVNKVETLEKSIHADLLRAEKDNDLVYMETVPQVSLLPPILRSDMVKPVMPSAITNPTQYIKSSAGEFNRPLFESLVPLAVHQAASVYADQKEQIMDVDIAGKYQVIQRDYESLMQSLDLPRALDIVDPNVLPTSLVLCNEEVQHGGGIRAIRDMINNVQTMSLKAADIVDEGFDAIEEENNHDEILRRQYGNLWTRPPSQLLTKALLTEGSKHHDTIQAAQKADRIVRAKLGSWSRPIEMLSRPVEEMKDSLPSIVSDESHYTQLQNLIDRLRKLIQESEDAAKFRQHLVEDARKLAAEDDISEALLAKASELTGGIPTVKIEPEQFKGVFTQELKKYGKFQLDMNTSVDAQVDRLETMQQVYEEFAMIVRSSDGAAKRQKAIQNLEMGFDKFKEIRTNLVEGINFYSKYMDTLTKFKNSCVDFAMARRMEASELAR